MGQGRRGQGARLHAVSRLPAYRVVVLGELDEPLRRALAVDLEEAEPHAHLGVEHLEQQPTARGILQRLHLLEQRVAGERRLVVLRARQRDAIVALRLQPLVEEEGDDELEAAGRRREPLADERPVTPTRHRAAHRLAEALELLLNADEVDAAAGLLDGVHDVGEQLGDQQALGALVGVALALAREQLRALARATRLAHGLFAPPRPDALKRETRW